MALMDIFSSRRSGAINAAITGLPPLPVPAPQIASPFSDNSHLGQLHAEHLIEAYKSLPPDRASAMSLSPVSKGRSIIAGTVARFPLVAMQGAQKHPQPPAWVTQIEPGRSRYQTIVWTVDALIFYGRAYWLIEERYSTGYPMRFRWVPEWEASADDNGYLTEAFGRKIAPSDYIRIDAHHEGFLRFGARILRKALSIEQAAENAARNPVPSIELHQVDGDDLTQEEIDQLVNAWRTARNSPNGATAYTNKAVEVRTHGLAAENLLIDAQNQSALAVARALGIPAWAVDASLESQSMSYSNSHSRARELIDFGLRPYMDAITSRLSMDDVLPAGSWVDLETNEIISPPMKERMEAYKVAIEAGIYTPEECRALDGGIPMEGKQDA